MPATDGGQIIGSLKEDLAPTVAAVENQISSVPAGPLPHGAHCHAPIGEGTPIPVAADGVHGAEAAVAAVLELGRVAVAVAPVAHGLDEVGGLVGEDHVHPFAPGQVADCARAVLPPQRRGRVAGVVLDDEMADFADAIFLAPPAWRRPGIDLKQTRQLYLVWLLMLLMLSIFKEAIFLVDHSENHYATPLRLSSYNGNNDKHETRTSSLFWRSHMLC